MGKKLCSLTGEPLGSERDTWQLPDRDLKLVANKASVDLLRSEGPSLFPFLQGNFAFEPKGNCIYYVSGTDREIEWQEVLKIYEKIDFLKEMPNCKCWNVEVQDNIVIVTIKEKPTAMYLGLAYCINQLAEGIDDPRVVLDVTGMDKESLLDLDRFANDYNYIINQVEHNPVFSGNPPSEVLKKFNTSAFGTLDQAIKASKKL